MYGDYMKFNKKDIVILSIIILFSISSILFTLFNDSFYKKEIMKIDSIETKESEISTNPFNFKEKYTKKVIKGTITNKSNKGIKKEIEYEESYSSIVTEKYKVGDKVFISNDDIDGLKRDTYIVILVSIFIIFMYLLGKIRGLITVLNVSMNATIFYLLLELYFKGMNLLLLCIIESIIFTIISLLISSGKNRKTMSAIVSTIVSTIILLLMNYIIIKVTDYKGTNFNELSFLTVPFEDVFLCSIMMGGLGAIMDVAISISSSLAELIEKDKNISNKNLIKSGKAIGKDILGTMMNVLFFTYLCSGLPIFVLALRNGYSISNYINNNFNLEITRFLTGSIGIVMTIPISIFISIKLLKKEAK